MVARIEALDDLQGLSGRLNAQVAKQEANVRLVARVGIGVRDTVEHVLL